VRATIVALFVPLARPLLSLILVILLCGSICIVLVIILVSLNCHTVTDYYTLLTTINILHETKSHSQKCCAVEIEQKGSVLIKEKSKAGRIVLY
jgi:hypothetical protein